MPSLAVLKSFQPDTTAVGTLVDATKPSGVEVGDLLVIIGCLDNATAGPNFLDNHAGWHFVGTAGNATSDAHIGIFWRIADGSEPATESITVASAGYSVSFYLRITGHNPVSPIHNSAFGTQNANSFTHNILGVETVLDKCLCLYGLSFHGGDGYPYSVSGEGWVEDDEAQYDTTSNTSSGCFGSKDLWVKGGAGTATVTSSVSDGSAFVQLAIAPNPGSDQAASIPDSRLWKPETRHRGRKPNCRVKINRKHWFGRRLLFSCIFNSANRGDLTKSRQLIYDKAFPYAVIDNRNVIDKTIDENTQLITVSPPLTLIDASEYTFLIAIKKTGTTSEGMLCGNNDDGNNYIWITATPGWRQYFDVSAGNTINGVDDITASVVDLAGSTDSDRGTSVYSNGVYIGRTENPAVTTTQFILKHIFHGFSGDGLYNFEGYMEYLHVVRGVMTQSEITKFLKHRYRFLIPA